MARGPAVVAFKADLADPDRLGAQSDWRSHRNCPRLHALPERRLGLDQLELIEPVGGDLEHLIFGVGRLWTSIVNQ